MPRQAHEEKKTTTTEEVELPLVCKWAEGNLEEKKTTTKEAYILHGLFTHRTKQNHAHTHLAVAAAEEEKEEALDEITTLRRGK